MHQQGQNTNWLLYGLIVVSVAGHLILALHISGLYESKVISYIELSLQNITSPSTRNIPRPRIRKKAPTIAKLNKVNIQKHHIPRFKFDPIKPGPMASMENMPVEAISMDDFIDGQAVFGLENIALNVNDGAQTDYMNIKDYFSMLKFKIESCKKYPESAQSKRAEGQVKVGFTIALNGAVSSIKIINATPFRALNDAALRAVKDASPFPRPPRHLFKKPIPVVLAIRFELT
jgi:periplasmic protein TonB